jgi:hypothetical protein
MAMSEPGGEVTFDVAVTTVEADQIKGGGGNSVQLFYEMRTHRPENVIFERRQCSKPSLGLLRATRIVSRVYTCTDC